MNKRMVFPLAILLAFTLLAGCKSGGSSPASAANAINQQTTSDPNTESSDPAEPRSGEMPLTEIEAELGYGYLLPDESEYTGTVISKLERPADEPAYICLEYTSDRFEDTVFVTKKKTSGQIIGAKDMWPELVDAHYGSSDTIGSVPVQFLGYTQYSPVAAYWEKDGFSYTVKADIGTTPDLRKLVLMFAETGALDIDPTETVSSVPKVNREMTMEEIESLAGFSYQLPDASEYDGTIAAYLEPLSMEDHKYCIELRYTPAGAESSVSVTKEPLLGEEPQNEVDFWVDLQETEPERINGTEVHYLCTSGGLRVFAYWTSGGYYYRLSSVYSNAVEDVAVITPLFVEKNPKPLHMPEDATMEEIAAVVGYSYQLPYPSEYDGTIVSMLPGGDMEKDRILLFYTSNHFSGTVIITKMPRGKAESREPALEWPSLTDAGTETVNGIEVHLRGNSPKQQQAAYWEWNGYYYELDACTYANGVNLMSILPIFVETE